MSDEVIEELWQIKDNMAREHGYDLARLTADLRDSQGQGGRAGRGLARLTGNWPTTRVGEKW